MYEWFALVNTGRSERGSAAASGQQKATILNLQHAIIEQIDTGLLVLGPDGDVVNVNQAGRDILGDSDGVLTGSMLATLLPDLASLLSENADDAPKRTVRVTELAEEEGADLSGLSEGENIPTVATIAPGTPPSR